MMRYPKLFFVLLAALALLACGDNGSEESYIGNARNHMADGNYAAASIELRNALQINNQSIQAHLLLGQVYLETADYRLAAKHQQHAAELANRSEDIATTLSPAQASLGYSDPAAVSRSAPNDPESQLSVVAATKAKLESLRLKGRMSNTGLIAAKQQLYRLLEGEPDNYLAWDLAGDFEQSSGEAELAIAAYSKALQLNDDSFHTLFKRAWIRVQRGEFAQAQTDINAVLVAMPEHPGAHYAQGFIHFRSEHYDKAVASFEVAEEPFPAASLFLGLSHWYQGNTDRSAHYANQFYQQYPDNVAARKLTAFTKAEQKEHDSVVRLLQPVVGTDPDDVTSLDLLADALFKLDKTDDGLELLAKVSHLKPDSAVAQFRLGAGLLHNGDLAAATQHLQAAIKLDSQNQQAGIMLALSLLHRGESETAMQVAQFIRESNPTSSAPYNLIASIQLAGNHSEQAQKAFLSALKIDPGNPRASHGLALMALQAEEFDAAIKFYQGVLDVHENYLPTLIRMSILHGLRQDEVAMTATLRRAITAHPEAYEPRLILARHYIKQKDGDAASVQILALEKHAPDDLRLLSLKGDLAFINRQYEELVRISERIFAAQPNGKTLIALVKARLAADDINGAISRLESWLAGQSGDLNHRIVLANLYLKVGEERKAIEQLEAVVSRDNANVFALNNLAWRLKEQRPRQALQYAEQAMILAPGKSAIMDTLAMVQLENRQIEQAQGSIEQAMQTNPADPGIKYHYAMIAHAAGDSATALETLESLLREKSEFPEKLDAQHLYSTLM
jgi:tetratricopeptide (TPR) repeat protein